MTEPEQPPQPDDERYDPDHGAGDPDPAHGEHDPHDPTLPERHTSPEDGDDAEPLGNVLHLIPALVEGEDATQCLRCTDLIGLPQGQLLRLEALAPVPSLTACGAHFHADLEEYDP